MDIKTVLNVTWPVPSTTEIILLILFLLSIIFFLAILRYNQLQKQKQTNHHQLFLFKLKRLGLSNFQIKLIYNFETILNLKDPNELLDKPALYEKAIAKFMIFLRQKNENEDSLETICKDIIITYDKIYNIFRIKKPLSSISDLEDKALLYFIDENKEIYLGRLVSIDKNKLNLLLFRPSRALRNIIPGLQIHVNLWRIGDAEYTFNSEVVSLQKKILSISFPDSLIREKELRHPYIDVIIPTKLINSDKGDNDNENEDTMPGTIYKLNDYEAVVRTDTKLDFQTNYIMKFELMDFSINAQSKIIAVKTIEENNTKYYTFKFTAMSDAANNVIKKYIYNHL